MFFGDRSDGGGIKRDETAVYRSTENDIIIIITRRHYRRNDTRAHSTRHSDGGRPGWKIRPEMKVCCGNVIVAISPPGPRLFDRCDERPSGFLAAKSPRRPFAGQY